MSTLPSAAPATSIAPGPVEPVPSSATSAIAVPPAAPVPEPDNNNIGANDWKYILGAGLLLTAFGGPLYLHYLCQWDLEVRWAVEEDYPRIYGLLANHLDLQSHIPAHAKNVDRAPAVETARAVLVDGTVIETAVSSTDTLSSLSAKLGQRVIDLTFSPSAPEEAVVGT